MRIQGCQLLADMVSERQPKRVLDLGSGITSIMFRELMKEYSEMMVVTTDTSLRWLDVTRKELVRDRLDTHHTYLQEEFESQTWESFDLISVDCDNLAYRVALAPKLTEWCRIGGMLMLDDWRMEHYTEDMSAQLAGHFVVAEPEHSRDIHGFTVALAERML